MRKGLRNLSLTKPMWNAQEILKTYEVYITLLDHYAGNVIKIRGCSLGCELHFL